MTKNKCTQFADTLQQNDVQSNTGERYTDKQRALLATFSLVYESKDGQFCLFEDKNGHLIAADARRFA